MQMLLNHCSTWDIASHQERFHVHRMLVVFYHGASMSAGLLVDDDFDGTINDAYIENWLVNQTVIELIL